MSPSASRFATAPSSFARRHRRAVVALASLLAGLSSQAQTAEWNGVTGNWTDWTNWNGLGFGQIPDDFTHVIVGNNGTAELLFAYGAADQLQVGMGSFGSLQLLGASFYARGATFLGNSGGAGELVIHDSTWNGDQAMIVGETATGTLHISGSSQVYNRQAFIGGQAGHTGTVTVNGGSVWRNSLDIAVGASGIGTLNISGVGSRVENTFALVGNAATGNGTVNVSDSAVWDQSQGLVIGNLGAGALNVASGGTVTSDTDSSVGRFAGATGAVIIQGSGSSWATSYVKIGEAGAGTLTLASGGSLIINGGSGNVLVGESGAASGTINIGAPVGQSAVAPGTLSAATISGGSGSGAKLLNFNHTTASLAFAPALSGPLSVQQNGAGTRTILTGDFTHSGTTTVNAGALQLGNGGGSSTASLGPVSIASGATLEFNRAAAINVNSALSGSGALIKNGSGTVSLLASSPSFSGPVTLNAGTLSLENAGATLGTGTVRVLGGGIRAGGAPRTLTNALDLGTNSPGGTVTDFVVGRSTTFSGAVTLSGATRLVASNPDALADADTTFSGNIQGPYALTIAQGAGAPAYGIGTGSIVLSGTNQTFTSLTIASGRLAASSGASLGPANQSLTFAGGAFKPLADFSTTRTLQVSTGGGTYETNARDTTFTTLTGSAPFTVNGGGTLRLSGTGVFTGGLTVASGTTFMVQNGASFAIGSGGTSGSLAGDLANFGSVTFHRSDSFTVSGALSGLGTYYKTGAGTLTLSGTTDNAFASFRVQAGTLLLAKDNSAFAHAIGVNLHAEPGTTVRLAGTGGDQIYLNATVQLDSGSSFDLNGRSEGFRFLTGSGSVANSAAATTSTLTLGQNDGTGTFTGSLANGAGTVALVKEGAGTITLSGSNTHTGGTTVNAGTLQVANLPAASAISVASGATLAHARADAFTFTGNITGAGAFSQSGAGDLTVAGSGTVSVSTLHVADADADPATGRLFLDRYTGTTLTKDGPGTLVLRATNIASSGLTLLGGTFQIGDGGTVGSLLGPAAISSGATLAFNRSNNVSYSGAISGAGGVTQLSATGDFTLHGALSFTGPVTVASDGDLVFQNTYTSAGALVKNGPGELRLAQAAAPALGTQINAGTLNLGANLSGPVSIASGATLALSSNVNLGGAVSGAGDVSALSSFPTLSGALTFTGPVSVASGADLTFSGSYTPAVPLVKTGAGTLTLSGTAAPTGGTQIQAGTLSFRNSGTLSGDIALSSGTTLAVASNSSGLTLAGAITGAGDVTVAANATFTGALGYTGSTFIASNANLTLSPLLNATFSSALTGTGVLSKAGPHTLTLLSDADRVFADAGTLRLGNGGATGFATSPRVSAGAVLEVNLDHDVAFTSLFSGTGTIRNVGPGVLSLPNNASPTNTLDVAAGSRINLPVSSSAIYTGALLGDGTFAKTGVGELRLRGDQARTGPLLIEAGTLAFDSDRDFTLTSPISGPGALLTAVNSGRTVTLLSAATHTGGTTVSSGTLQIGDGGAAGSVTGIITVNQSDTLAFNRSDRIDHAGLIQGQGSVVQRGSGQVHLPSANTYSGGTSLDAGSLLIGHDSALGTGRLTVNSGTLRAEGAPRTVANLLTFGGDATFGPDLTFTAKATLTGDRTFTTTGGGGPVIFSNEIEQANGPGRYLTITRTGSLGSGDGDGYIYFTGGNAYQGGTIVRDGGLLGVTSDFGLSYSSAFPLLLDNGTLRALDTFTNTHVTTVANQATLVVDAGKTLTYTGVIGGGGSLSVQGSGLLVLSANHTFTGGLTRDNGALVNTGALVAAPGVATVSGANLALLNRGSITGGTGANAVTFTGTTNSLELQSGTAITGTVSAGGAADTFILGGASNASFNTALVGPAAQYRGFESFTKTGASTWTLSGSATQATPWQITAGTLALSTGATLGDASGTVTFAGGHLRALGTTALANPLALSADATFTTDNPATLTLSGPLSGSGALTKAGVGTLLVTSDNPAYTAAVTVSAGTLRLGSGGATGSLAGPITNHGVLVLDRSDSALDLSAAVSGSGSLSVVGSGTVTLSGANSFTGGATLGAGTLVIGSTDALGSTGALSFTGGALRFSSSNTTDYSARFSSAANQLYRLDTAGQSVTLATGFGGTGGTLQKLGAGTLTLSAANAFTGGSTLSAGTLVVGHDSALGSGPLSYTAGTLAFSGARNLANNLALSADLALAPSAALTLSGVISEDASPRSLSLSGPAAITLAGQNTFTGGTTRADGALIVPGRLLAAADGTALTFTGGTHSLEIHATTTLAGNILASGTADTLILGGATDASFDTALLGPAAQYRGFESFAKTGASTWTLSGSTAQHSPWTLSAGTLALATGATLGDPAGSVTFAGGHLQALGDVSLANPLVFSSAATLGTAPASTLTLSGPLSGSGALTKSGTGTLLVTSSNPAYTAAVTVSAGTLRLGSGGSAGSLAGPIENHGLLVLDRSDSALDLASALSGPGSLSVVGSGTVTLSGANTFTGGATLSAGTLVLGSADALGASGTVSLEGGLLRFSSANTTDYSARFSSAAAQLYRFDTADQSVTLASDLVSTGGTLEKSGPGTLTLSGANTYDGGTTLAAGTLDLASDTALGSGPLVVNSGNLAFTGTRSIANAITLATDLTLAPADPLTLSGLLSEDASPRSLTVSGAGPVTLTAANTFSGGATLASGGLVLAHDQALGSGPLTYTGGTLAFSGARTFANSLVLDADLALAPTDPLTLSANISEISPSSPRALTFSGPASVTLSGANTHTGGTTLAGGSVLLASAGALGSAGPIAFTGGTLVFSAANTTDYSARFSTAPGQAYRLDTSGQSVTLASPLAGTDASLAKLGAGTLTLSAANTFTQGVTLGGGTLVLGHADALGSSGPISLEGGLLRFSAANTTDYSVRFSAAPGQSYRFDTDGQDVLLGSPLVSSGGTLEKLGEGTLSLAATNSYTGGTVLSAGILGLAAHGALGSGPLRITGGTIRAEGTGRTVANSTTFAGDFTLGRYTDFTGPLTLENDITLTAANPGAGGGHSALRGDIGESAGPARLTLAAGPHASTLALGGANTYTGGTTFAGGTVFLDSPGALGSVGEIRFTGGTLAYTAGNTTDYSARFSTDAAQPISILTNGVDVTFASPLTSPGGSLAKTGSGVLTLGGASTYTGGTTINQGTLRLSADERLPDVGELRLSPGTVLDLQGHTETVGSFVLDGATVTAGTLNAGSFVASAGNIHASLGGSGTLTKLSGGTLTLHAPNTHTGGTTLTDGTVVLNADHALGTTGPIIFDGGEIRFSANDLTDYSARISVTHGRSLEIDTNGQDITFASSMAVAGAGLYKSGSGTLTLSAANPFSGSVPLYENALAVGHAQALGTAHLTLRNSSLRSTVGPLTLANNTSLNGTVTLGGDLTLSGNHTLYYGDTTFVSDNPAAGPGRTTLGSITEANVPGADLTFISTATGAGFTLAGPLTHTGGTTLASGVLALGTSDLLPDARPFTITSGTFDLGAHSDTVGALTLASGSITGTGILTSTTDFAVSSGDISARLGGTVAVVKTTGGTLTLSGDNTFSGGVTFSAGALVVAHDSALGSGTLAYQGGALVFSGARSLANPVSLGADLSLSLSAPLTLSGPVSLGGNLSAALSAPLTVSGLISEDATARALAFSGSSVTLSAANTFSGGVTLGSATTLVVAHDSALGTSPLTLDGSTLSPSGDRSLANALALAPRPLARDASFLTVAPADRLALSGVISGDANHFLVKNGAGTLELTGANTFGGGLSLEGGHLLVGHDQSLGTGSLVLIDGTLAFSGERTLANAISLQTDLTLDLTADTTLSGRIHGLAGHDITKTGAGTLTLSHANTDFHGDFTVSAGTLELLASNAAGRGLLTLASGTRLVASGTLDQWVSVSGAPQIDNPAPLSIGQLILNEDTVLDVAQPLTLGALRGGSERFEKTGPGSLTLSAGLLWNGEFVHSQGTLYLDDQHGAGSTSLVLNGGALSSHNATQAVAAPVTLTRDTALPAEVEFTFIAPLTLATDVALDVAGRLHLAQGFRDFGAGHDLSLTGAGTLVLSGASDFSGTLDHRGGTLQIDFSTHLGDGSLLLSGGALHTGDDITNVSLGAPVTFAASTSITGLGILDFTGAATVENDLTLTHAAELRFSGTLSADPDLTLVKAGPGALHIDGTMDLDGGLVIRDGEVHLHNTSLSAPILIEGGGLITRTAAPIANHLRLDGDFTLGAFGASEGVFSGDITLARDVTLTTTGAPVRLTGGLSDEGNDYQLTVTGDGTLLLDGTNYYSNPIGLVGGTLGFTDENSLGYGRLTLGGGTFYSTSPTTLALSNELTLSGSTLQLHAFTFTGDATLVGDTLITAVGPVEFADSIGEDSSPRALSFANSPAPVTLSGDNTFSGGLDLTHATAIIRSDTAAGTGPLTLSDTTLETDGFYDLENSVSIQGNLTVDALAPFSNIEFEGPIHLASNVTLSGYSLGFEGVISDGGTPRALSSSLFFLYLGGDNTFSGGFTSTGTIIGLGSDTAFGTGLVTLHGGGLEAYDTPRTLANSLVLAGGTLQSLGDAPITLSGPVSIQADTRLQPFVPLTLSGDLTGSAPLRVDGAVPLILSGDNALYIGGVRVEGGVLHFGSNTAAGTAPIRTSSFSTLGASRSVDLANSVIATGRLDIDNAHDLRIRGGLTQSGGLLFKTGPGRLTLDGAVSLADAPEILAGSLYINGDLSMGPVMEGYTPSLVVRTGVTLGGSGTVHGNLSLNTGGALAPGNSPGELTIDGTVNLFGPATYVFELGNATGAAGTDWDLLSVTGDFFLNSHNLHLNVVSLGAGGAPGALPGFNPATDYRWTFVSIGGLVAADPASIIVTTSGFVGASNGDWTTVLSPDGQGFDLLYTSAIPEPAACATLAALAALGLASRRRRRA